TFNVAYSVDDGRGGTASATVVVTVNPPANQPPTATDDAIALASGASGAVSVADNATDPDGDPLSYAITSTGGLPSATVNAAGLVSVTAPAVTVLTTFNVGYSVDDGRGGTDTATVVVTVNPPPP
ncbi:MAG: Ig-like domain-containing protein, partial [Pseudomonadota bacterium]